MRRSSFPRAAAQARWPSGRRGRAGARARARLHVVERLVLVRAGLRRRRELRLRLPKHLRPAAAVSRAARRAPRAAGPDKGERAATVGPEA